MKSNRNLKPKDFFPKIFAPGSFYDISYCSEIHSSHIFCIKITLKHTQTEHFMKLPNISEKDKIIPYLFCGCFVMLISSSFIILTSSKASQFSMIVLIRNLIDQLHLVNQLFLVLEKYQSTSTAMCPNFCVSFDVCLNIYSKRALPDHKALKAIEPRFICSVISCVRRNTRASQRTRFHHQRIQGN